MKRRPDNRRTGGVQARLFLLALVLLAAILTGVTLGFGKLRALYLQQFAVRDLAAQVHILPGKMVLPDVLAAEFGLRKGANLAEIDFTAKRESVLAKIPNLRAVSVTRRLPDQVTIVPEEREPIARFGLVGRKRETGKVADVEGMVFYCQRGTRMLPVVREANDPGTSVGHRATGRAFAALQLIEACRDPDYQEFGLLEVDVSRTDYLYLTLGGAGYSRVKLAWAGMDEPPTPESRANLLRQLRHLREAIRSRVGEGTVVWNATDTSNPGRIYADSKGRIP